MISPTLDKPEVRENEPWPLGMPQASRTVTTGHHAAISALVDELVRAHPEYALEDEQLAPAPAGYSGRVSSVLQATARVDAIAARVRELAEAQKHGA